MCEKRLARIKELQEQQQRDIERATGHLRRASSDPRTHRSPSHTARSPPPSARKEEEEKTSIDVVISSPRPVAAVSVVSTTLPLSAPSTPQSSAQSFTSVQRHQRSGSAQSTSTPPTASSSRRTSTPATPDRSSRKSDWDYEGLPGARPGLTRSPSADGPSSPEATSPTPARSDSAVPAVPQRLARVVTMETVSEPGEREGPRKRSAGTAVGDSESAVSRPTPGEASSAFGLTLKKVPSVPQRPLPVAMAPAS